MKRLLSPVMMFEKAWRALSVLNFLIHNLKDKQKQSSAIVISKDLSKH